MAVFVFALGVAAVSALPAWSLRRCCGKACVGAAGACLAPLVLFALVPLGMWRGGAVVAAALKNVRGAIRVEGVEESDIPRSVRMDFEGAGGMGRERPSKAFGGALEGIGHEGSESWGEGDDGEEETKFESEFDDDESAIDGALTPGLASKNSDDEDFQDVGNGDLKFAFYVIRELYYKLIDALHQNSTPRVKKSPEPPPQSQPFTCAADDVDGSCSASPPRLAELRSLFNDAVTSGPDDRLVCFWESVFNCRGFSEGDCPPEIAEGACATGERAVRGGEAPCRCIRCPLVMGLDKPSGCASAVLRRGDAAVGRLVDRRMLWKAVFVAAEAVCLVLLVLFTYFVLVCCT